MRLTRREKPQHIPQAMPFQPYDPGVSTVIHRRDLPHWQQAGTTYFVTFRMADSLPAARLQELEADRLDWLLSRGISSPDKLMNQPDAIRHEYAKTFNARWHALLDSGYGACLLREPALRQHVSGALRHFHGTRLGLGPAVVMPNHVHALISPLPGHRLEDLMHSIKRFSARAINTAVARKGSLWFDETWDHIVRSETQLQHYRHYIEGNPAKAGLHPHEYWLNS